MSPAQSELFGSLRFGPVRMQEASKRKVRQQTHEQEPPTATLLCGDAFDLISQLPKNSVDLLITSPPYWGLRTYSGDHNWDVLKEWSREAGGSEAAPPYDWYRERGGVLGLEPHPDWYVAHLTEFFDRAKSVVKPSGSVWVNVGDTYFARWASIREKGRQGLGGHARTRRRVPMGGYRQEKQLLLIPSRFAIAMQERRWILRNDMIWYKPNVPPRPEKDRLRLSHEHFFHFVHRPTTGRAKYFYDLSYAERPGNDVVTCFVRRGEADHTATFPEQLIAPRILTSCPVGGTVFDPFAGTGRALAVAFRNGMNAIGFEIWPAFVKIAKKLLAEAGA